MAQDETSRTRDAGSSSATILSQDIRTAPIAITTSCEEVVALYRNGGLERTQAVDQLGTIIAGAPGGIGGNPGALQAHLSALYEWDREQAEAATRGGEGHRAPGQASSETVARGATPSRSEGGAASANRDADISGIRGILAPFPGSEPRSPAEPARAARWNEVDPADYAWNWKVVGMPIKWRTIEPLTRQTQLLRGTYTKDPKQAIASLLDQFDKPMFPPSLWKTVLLNEFLELEKLYGETFTLKATKPDTYSLGPKVEIEIQESGGGAKSKAVKDFGIWASLWDQYAAAVTYVYPHRVSELTAYRKWIVNYFMFSRSPGIVLDIDHAIRRAIVADTA